MTGTDKKDAIRALYRNMQDLRECMDRHAGILSAVLEKDEEANGGFQAAPLAAEARMRAALKEAVFVLDESRKAFKSRRLEELRKRLTDVLTDGG